MTLLHRLRALLQQWY